MFLTTSDGRIFHIRDGKAVIGSGGDCAVRLIGPGIESHHCEIADDGFGERTLTNISGRPVFVNGTAIQTGSLPIMQSSQIRIAQYDFEVWEASNSGPIASSLRNRLFDFEKDLQNAVLDKLRNLPPSQNEKEERNH